MVTLRQSSRRADRTGRHHLAPDRVPLSYLVPGRYPSGERHRAPEALVTYIRKMAALRNGAWL